MKRFFAGLCLAAMMLAPALAQNLPVGTGMKMKLETPISTERSKPGDLFHGRVREPVRIDGRTIIPVGTAIQGRVVHLSEPRRIAGTPEIVLRPDRITLPNGNEYALSATIVDTDKASKTTVDDEGKIHGPGRSGHDNAELIGGAGGGTVIGALAGGAKGGLIGSAVGVSVAAAHWMTKRHSATLPAGSEITLELSRPMSLSAVDAGE